MDELTQSRRKRHDREFRLAPAEVAAATVFFSATLAAFVLFPGHAEQVLALFTVVAGGGMALDEWRNGEDDALPPASAAFLAAADPTRPLGEPSASSDGDLARAAVGPARAPLFAALQPGRSPAARDLIGQLLFRRANRDGRD